MLCDVSDDNKDDVGLGVARYCLMAVLSSFCVWASVPTVWAVCIL